jgi:hypothetical protein
MSTQVQEQGPDTNELQTWKRMRTAQEIGAFLNRHFDALDEMAADKRQDFSDIEDLAA